MTAQMVCAITDVAPGAVIEAEVYQAEVKTPLAIARDNDGGWHAIDGYCTHDKIPLAEGEVIGCEIECWAHGARFNLNTGEATLPAVDPVKVYSLNLTDELVLVDPSS